MIRRVFRLLLLALLGGAVLFYAAFALLLAAGEHQLLGQAPSHDSIDVRSREPHAVALLDEGADSLAARVRLIERARRSIDLEFFIYEIDDTSRLFSRLLARKAAEGVRVRLLVDFAAPVFRLGPAYAAQLAASGVEVRYYNTASLLRFFAVQHRTHRKFLAVDGETAIVGGRNVADEYFDAAERYNFLDCDLQLTGPLVAAMERSFELYWNSAWAATPPAPGRDRSAPDFLAASAADEALEREVRRRQARPFESVCRDVHFVTDYPGAGVERRRVYPALEALAAEVRSEIVLESPYFVVRGEGAGLIRDLLGRGVRIEALTNSLRSTDAFYTVAALLPRLDDLEHPGLTLGAYRGHPPAGVAAPRSPLWGVHAKRGVFDGSTTVVGTYNIDPRSANLNAEMIVVCRDNPELAAEVRRSIQRRIAQSTRILGGGEAAGARGLVRGAALSHLVKMALSLPLARNFEFLL